MLCPFQQTINRGYGILPIMEMILRIFNPNSLVIKWMS
jgi:hypothetical protein